MTEVNDAEVRYQVPEGQDPAVVLAALVEAGYAAAPDRIEDAQIVKVSLPEDTARAREGVRETIGRARATNLEGPPVLDPAPVRFLGEDPAR